jgi:hypothetical protein
MAVTLEGIKAAFSGVNRPRGEQLSDCLCGECTDQVATLRGRDWSEFRFEDISTGYFGCLGLNADAFLYFLPGILMRLKELPDDANLSLLLAYFTGSDNDTPAQRQDFIRRILMRMTSHQRELVSQLISALEVDGYAWHTIADAAKRSLSTSDVVLYSAEALKREIAEGNQNTG